MISESKILTSNDRTKILRTSSGVAYAVQKNGVFKGTPNIPTSWVEIKISEGMNRQVRRMTAAVNFPTLRLIRYAIGDYTLKGIKIGEFKLVGKK